MLILAAIKKAPETQRFSSIRKSVKLLDLGFLELNMLAHYRIILAEHQLVSFRARILFGYIKKAGIFRRRELNLDYVAFSHNKTPIWRG